METRMRTKMKAEGASYEMVQCEQGLRQSEQARAHSQGSGTEIW